MYLHDPSGDGVRTGTPTRVTELLRTGVARLRAAGVPDADRDAEWLLGEALGINRSQLHLDGAACVPVAVRRRFGEWCARRAHREPLQYILGTQPFWSCDLRVNRHVLIPRPETERVVELCLSLHQGGPIADIGTGSGAIAIAMAIARPGEAVMATDASPSALSVARRNARAAGISNVSFVCGDLLEPLLPTVATCTLVVCNPPYIATEELQRLAPEVRDWEPRVALDGGPDGLEFYRRLAPAAASAMQPGAWMVMEIGADQRAAVETFFAGTAAFDKSVVNRDYRGIDRVLGFRRGGSRTNGRSPTGGRLW